MRIRLRVESSLADNITLCFANMLMAGFIEEFMSGFMQNAKIKYEMAREVLDELEATYADRHKIFVMKSGILVGFVNTEAYNTQRSQPLRSNEYPI